MKGTALQAVHPSSEVNPALAAEGGFLNKTGVRVCMSTGFVSGHDFSVQRC